LAATIRELRPDLLLEYANKTLKPIGDTPPQSYFLAPSIPGTSGLMLASVFQNQPVHHWWMGEKYDGVRAFWNGSDRNLYSRQGKTLALCHTMYPHFPQCCLDGELWCGRQRYDSLASISKGSGLPLPTSFRYVAFDSASIHSVWEYPFPFEKRILKLLSSIQQHNPLIIPTFRLFCHSIQFLRWYANSVIASKGEGVIARKPFSLYEQGLSKNLIKVKEMLDAEALVVDIQNSYYICKLPDDNIVKATRKNRLSVQIGDIVTFTRISSSKNSLQNTLY